MLTNDQIRMLTNRFMEATEDEALTTEAAMLRDLLDAPLNVLKLATALAITIEAHRQPDTWDDLPIKKKMIRTIFDIGKGITMAVKINNEFEATRVGGGDPG